jgi:hypothetical protein
MKRRAFYSLLMLLLVSSQFGSAADDKVTVPAPKPIALKFIASDSNDSQPGVHTFASAEDLEKKNPKLLQQFDRAIDFKSEDLVLVQWGSSGPPFGKLTFKTDKTSITFAVEEPKADIRGQAYKLGADWFTVAKGTKIVMSK